MAGYIGRDPRSEAIQSRAKFTIPTGGQTSFLFAYQPGFLDVYLNGIKIEDTTDYVATTGTEVVLTSAATVGQVLELVGLITFSLVNGKINYSAAGAPTTGDDSVDGYRVGSMWIDTTNEEVYRCVDDTMGAAVWRCTTTDTDTVYSHPSTDGNLHVPATLTSNNGKYLKAGSTAGSLSWAEIDALPTQTGHTGKYLTTDGVSTASWSTIDTTGNKTDQGLYEHANTISTNYSIASGNNAMTAGPITINTGASVTIPTGSAWVIA